MNLCQTNETIQPPSPLEGSAEAGPQKPRKKLRGKTVRVAEDLENIKVSPEDRDLIIRCAYNYRKTGNKGYYRRIDYRTNKTVYLHREILERMLGRRASKHEFADHINGDILDNRRENLRVSSVQQNSQNKHGLLFRGTSLHKCGKWQASVKTMINGKPKFVYCGLFTERADAVLAAARKRAELGFASSIPDMINPTHPHA